jgi:hypothetical protein
MTICFDTCNLQASHLLVPLLSSILNFTLIVNIIFQVDMYDIFVLVFLIDLFLFTICMLLCFTIKNSKIYY